MADIGRLTYDTCICPRDDWCICGATKTTKVTPKTYKDGAAKAKEPIGCSKIAGEDLTKKNGQDQGATKGTLSRVRNHQCPSETGAPPCSSKTQGKDLPLPHGGPPLPQRTVPLERLAHLRRMEGLDAHGGGVEGPKLQVPCRGATLPRLPALRRHLVHLQTP